MKPDSINTNSSITLNYTLIGEDGLVIDSTQGEEPLCFNYGDGTFPEAVERIFIGLHPEDSGHLAITPETGWGYPSDDNIHRLPLEDFPDPSVISLDNIIEFQLSNNESTPGRVTQITDKEVEIDFNPPLSGLNLELIFTIVAVNNINEKQ